ncbi:hypothetical protein SAMN04488168_1784 [Bacillus sp. 491mf]|uniref:hypothetical protein n=1 Tax=Bacillus sp. 491mf TaxID=1761755 RepID=UPI0008E10434|nr:hypothetical protein [Bacillus sp. 491mf]SFD70185.1 hypothetical protein SAMN04488168_1784 [Bacillus sp. 491mf]
MREKLLVLFSMIITFFTFLVSNVYASSPLVIDKEKAGGYQYTMIEEQTNFTWKIGYRDNLVTLQENKDNTENLAHFRTAVRDIRRNIFEMILYVSYFLIIVLIALIFYKKNKQTFKRGRAIFVIFAGIALYATFTASIELNTALKDAKFYYSVLTK